MSADVPTVVLTGPAMVPLVRAAAALETEDIPPFAVIGGVAVTVRLGRVMRATADLDAVTDQRYTPTALEILCSRDDTAYDATHPHTITISGAEVQFQDVEPVGDADVSHLEDRTCSTSRHTPMRWQPQHPSDSLPLTHRSRRRFR